MAKSFAEYLEPFPAPTRKLLKQMRSIIKKAAPKASEKISYGVPTFDLEGNLVHFGGFKSHVSLFPGPTAITKFKAALARYARTKGTLRFALDEPLPVALIEKIVRFRVKENLSR